jgi:hypothetical protein
MRPHIMLSVGQYKQFLTVLASPVSQSWPYSLEKRVCLDNIFIRLVLSDSLCLKVITLNSFFLFNKSFQERKMKVEGNKCVTYIEKIYDKKRTVFNKEEKQHFNKFFFLLLADCLSWEKTFGSSQIQKLKKKKNEKKNSNSKKSFERK